MLELKNYEVPSSAKLVLLELPELPQLPELPELPALLIIGAEFTPYNI